MLAKKEEPGDEKMSRSKERVKLYKKVRNTSLWGSVIMYILLIIMFLAMMLFLAGFVLEYIFETKFAEGYRETQQLAQLYDAGNGDKSITDYINKLDNDFIVKDKSGRVVFQKGKNTCSDNGGEVELSNGKEKYMVYADTETDYIYPDGDGGLDVRFKELVDYISSHENNTRLPIWVETELSGEKTFIAKAYLTVSTRDTVLVIELLAGVVGIVVVIGVITIIKIIRSVINYRRVVKLFYHDPVTMGHNWNWYIRYGDDRIHDLRTRKYSFAVVNLVFRNYRNYCLCHSIADGEKMLARINGVLTGELEKNELCAHATMSNFALLLRCDSEESLKQRLEQLIAKLQGMDSEHNFAFQIGADVVKAQKSENGHYLKRRDMSIENAYNNACSARATLADTEESGVRIFDSGLLEEQRWYDTVHEHQQTALKNEEFVVYYQPKYDPRTNVLKGAEALVRWDSPEFGFVTPGRIIPIFEKNGFITEIDHYMIAHAARDQKMWLDKGYKCVPVSVNVSRAHFVENDLAQQIRDIVDKEQCPHELIEIELTESAFFDDKKAMIKTIKKLREYGFAVSMDDFGAGYSSLNSLKDMPLDVLKLDAGFFRGENEGERGEIVVSEAIKLAKNLKMRTVAEGVEEKAQVDFLAQQGCDMIQGYYFAKPMPREEYVHKMERTDDGGAGE